VSLVELSVTLGIVIVLLQQHFQLVMITLLWLTGSFHDRKRIDCYGNDNSWLYRFTDCSSRVSKIAGLRLQVKGYTTLILKLNTNSTNN
jgi:hypothetical protein